MTTHQQILPFSHILLSSLRLGDTPYTTAAFSLTFLAGSLFRIESKRHKSNQKMKKQTAILYFSPTGSTKQICEQIAAGLGDYDPRVFNMTSPDIRHNIKVSTLSVADQIDHWIVGAPVYSGKLPVQVLDCLEELEGHGRECSAIVVYGNRDYGIALRSLITLLSNTGFNVVSAGAFIGQHSYSDIVPIAMNRPDKSDIEVALQFGFESQYALETLIPDDIPVQLDKHSRSSKYTSLKPTFDKNSCQQCGRCSCVCPLGLIEFTDGQFLNRASRKQCIGCMACVKICRKKARIIKANPVVKLIMNRMLKQAALYNQDPLTILK
jgi:Pyruvate/2-oxoacid:ferredoxin oxidoreductase delta subunit